MTSDSRAVSTTSRLITLSPLISSTRVIWVKSRWTIRKFPLVMRWTAAMASVSVKSSADSVRPTVAQWRCWTKASSPADSGRVAAWGDCLAVRGDAGEEPVEPGLESELVVLVVQQACGAEGGEVREVARVGEALQVCLGRGPPAGVVCGVAVAVIPGGADVGVAHGVGVHGAQDGQSFRRVDAER